MPKLDRIVFIVSVVVIAGAVLIMGLRMINPDVTPNEKDYTLADSIVTGDTGLSVRVSQEKANSILRSSLPGNLYISDVQLSFNADESIRVTGLLNLRRAAKEHTETAGILSGITSLLPEEIGFSAVLNILAANGGISVRPDTIEVMGYTLPAGIIPSAVTDAVEKSITEAVAGTGLEITAIHVEKGAVTVDLQ